MRRRDLVLAGAAIAAGSGVKASADPAKLTPTFRLAKFRFKRGGRKVWEEWSAELMRRRTEVVETLRNEGAISEACFLSEDGEHVYYFTEVADPTAALAAFAKSHFPIDAEHRIRKAASLELVAELKPLFAFQNPQPG